MSNSKNMLGVWWKAAIKPQNAHEVLTYMEATEQYILGLCDKPGGTPICKSNRKTGFIGFYGPG